jgi:hypothetical protein
MIDWSNPKIIRCKLVMPVLAKAAEMGLRMTNNRKRNRKRMRQALRHWDPFAGIDIDDLDTDLIGL